MAAALFFYLQQSRLAWFYGQITLCEAMPGCNGRSLEQWLEDADAWDTWVPYQTAFGFLLFAFWPYSIALLRDSFDGLKSFPFEWTVVVQFVGVLVILGFRAHVLRRNRLIAHPFREYARQLFG